MLVELRIVNFALIEQLYVQFDSGFTVLTGETGAGKSLLIDAIALLVGGRASTEFIRAGEDEAQLEACFQLPAGHPLLLQLRGQALIGPEDNDLILRRILSRSGRHRVYLNGSLCPLRVLEQLGGTLVDIHGQHEQQSLLASTRQLDALDSFGSLLPLRQRYEDAYRDWRALMAQLDATKQAGFNRDRMEEFLRFQVREIEQAHLQIGEDEILTHDRQRLVHARRLRELAEESYAELQADDQGILVKLGRVNRLLAELGQTDPLTSDYERQTREASIVLKELSRQLRDYANRSEEDPDRQNQVETRLDVIERLKKKYGGSISAVLDTGERFRQELHTIETHESRIGRLTEQLEAAEARVADMAKQLSKKRREAARRLAALVAVELAAVKMERTTFDVTVASDDDPPEYGATGQDSVEFLLSSNVGEPPRALSRIASGGELSRIMLALKTVLAQADQVPILVFDEIDTGIGGAVAAAMGMRLRKLGRFHQVFCITHLPQVASQAEHHVIVEKVQDGRRTVTSVKVLNGIRREEEIARMLGGETITKKVRETAAELIAGAREKR